MLSIIRLVYFLILLQQVLSKTIQNNSHILMARREKGSSLPFGKTIIDINDKHVIKDYSAIAKRYLGVILKIGDYISTNSTGSVEFERHYANLKDKTNIGYYFGIKSNSTIEEVDRIVYNVNILIKDKQNNFPVFVNMVNGFTSVYKKDNTNIALEGIKLLEKYGYKPGFFSNDNTLKNSFDLEKIMQTNAYIWIARYGRDNGNYDPHYRPKEYFDLFQYTSNSSDEDIKSIGNIGGEAFSKSILNENSNKVVIFGKNNYHNNNKPWVYVIIIGVGIAILLGLIFGFIFYNKNKSKNNNNRDNLSTINYVDFSSSDIKQSSNEVFIASPPPPSYEEIYHHDYNSSSSQQTNYTLSSSVNLLQKTNLSYEQYSYEMISNNQNTIQSSRNIRI